MLKSRRGCRRTGGLFDVDAASAETADEVAKHRTLFAAHLAERIDIGRLIFTV